MEFKGHVEKNRLEIMPKGFGGSQKLELKVANSLQRLTKIKSDRKRGEKWKPPNF